MRLKGTALWATQVNFQNFEDGHNPTYKQWGLSLQPMVNLTNLFGGYKPRVWNISLYGGAGFTANFGGLDLEDETKNYSMLFTVGVFNTFNITKRFHINLDIYCNAGEDDTDGIDGKFPGRRILQTRDTQFGMSAGIGVNLGKVGWDNAPDVDAIMAMNQAQLDALNASLADAEAENARLKAQIANHKCPTGETKTITEFATTSASVFFNINSSKVASKKDLVNVKELAELAKQNDAKGCCNWIC